MPPWARLAPVQAVEQWKRQKAQLTAQMPPDGRRAPVATRNAIVRELHAAGARLLVGSDSPQLFMLPGFGVLREIDALVAAGLSRYAALVAATRAPAEYLGRAAEQGTVAAGRRADLLLLDADPLADATSLRRVAGMMFDGRWLDASQLTRLRDAVDRRLGGS